MTLSTKKKEKAKSRKYGQIKTFRLVCLCIFGAVNCWIALLGNLGFTEEEKEYSMLNLIKNGGFEDGFFPWRKLPFTRNIDFSLDNGARSKHSALINIKYEIGKEKGADCSYTSYGGLQSNAFWVTPNAPYRLKFRARSDKPGAKLTLKLLGEHWFRGDIGEISLTTGWRTYTLEFNAPELHRKVDLGIYPSTDAEYLGKLWVDEVSVSPGFQNDLTCRLYTEKTGNIFLESEKKEMFLDIDKKNKGSLPIEIQYDMVDFYGHTVDKGTINYTCQAKLEKVHLPIKANGRLGYFSAKVEIRDSQKKDITKAEIRFGFVPDIASISPDKKFGNNFQLGIQTSCHYSLDQRSTLELTELLKRGGVEIIRTQGFHPFGGGWSSLLEYETSAAGKKHIDSVVQPFLQNNIQCMLVLPREVEWRTLKEPIIHWRTKRKKTSGSFPTLDISLFRNCISSLAKRYKDQIYAFEMGNEPNLGAVTKKYTDPELTYAYYSRIAYNAVKSVNPKAAVSTAGFANMGMDFAQKLLDINMGLFCDVVAFHPYRQNPNKNLDENIVKLLDIVKSANRRLDIWDTERGFLTGVDGMDPEKMGPAYIFAGVKKGEYSPGWGGKVVQTGQLCKIITMEYCLGVKKSFWFTFPSIVNPDYGPKPAYPALSNLAYHLRGTQPLGQLETEGEWKIFLFQARDGRCLKVIWNTYGEGTYEIESEEKISVFDIMGNSVIPKKVKNKYILTFPDDLPYYLYFPKIAKDADLIQPVKIKYDKDPSLEYITEVWMIPRDYIDGVTLKEQDSKFEIFLRNDSFQSARGEIWVEDYRGKVIPASYSYQLNSGEENTFKFRLEGPLYSGKIKVIGTCGERKLVPVWIDVEKVEKE